MHAQNLEDLLRPAAGEKLVFDTNPVLNERLTHYCPGCHHGIAHRLVSETLHELGVAERTILVASVGCATFTYDYFNVDGLEAPHGRACAVATGVRRARPEAVVFTYQGDGDMAAIGMAESLHAANRGERITAIFINNTVYGMTGGQMAPTTLLGQKTTTTRDGRRMEREGGPIHLAEIMAGLDGVAFAARCALDTVRHVREAKKAMRRAFEAQIRGLGFGFLELLSGCPTNWHMDPVAASRHIAEAMIPVFPLGVFRDRTAEAAAAPRTGEAAHV
ncbi:thiamine pyrophosphate-dependent enzyme [uncultured Desulfovibrio sp.]|uniref:thiamine pyrophosphate-dependent enzyme n=1 Tax=uncultured Desulfovibrio sp. TaxID=167968 RepID=UPI00262D29FF|nr:thiamine pyrophosphate-dependent enzyme [uncultured Desulfovibrio sp.]